MNLMSEECQVTEDEDFDSIGEPAVSLDAVVIWRDRFDYGLKIVAMDRKNSTMNYETLLPNSERDNVFVIKRRA